MSTRENDTIVSLDEQHKWFITEEKELAASVIGLRSVQVDATERMYVYRDGAFYKDLGPGPHSWWSGFFHTWKIQRINMRTEQLPIKVHGRVQGPALPKEIAAAAGIELVCNVAAKLELSCQLIDIGKFLQYRKPLTAFNASVSNMVIEEIGRLHYDQYGQWATQLRTTLGRRLDSENRRDNPLYQIGVQVIDVFVTEVAADSAYDEEMLRKFKLIERMHNELIKAQTTAQIGMEQARSQADRSRLLGMSPAVVKIMEELKDDSIGRTLIQQDAELRKLQIGITGGFAPPDSAAGLANEQAGLYINNPASNDRSGYLLNSPQPGGPSVTPPAGSWQPGGQPYAPPFGASQPGNASFGTPPSPQSWNAGNQYGGQNSGSLPSSAPFSNGPTNIPNQPSGPIAMPAWEVSEEPVAPERRKRELDALRQSGLEPSEHTAPSYDQSGRPIAGSKEWQVTVYIPRPNDQYLTIVFYCAMDYPQRPPRVQVRQARGGFRSLTPNMVSAWRSDYLLLDLARELDRDIPDVL